MKYEREIKVVKERLSDFQSATVDYIDQRFYEDGQNRMLVADEVGLGKTWIAKGVVAKAFERWAKEKEQATCSPEFVESQFYRRQAVHSQSGRQNFPSRPKTELF